MQVDYHILCTQLDGGREAKPPEEAFPKINP